MVHIVLLEDTFFIQFGSDHGRLAHNKPSRTDSDTVLHSKEALLLKLCLGTKQKPRVKTQHHPHYESRWLWCLPFKI